MFYKKENARGEQAPFEILICTPTSFRHPVAATPGKPAARAKHGGKRAPNVSCVHAVDVSPVKAFVSIRSIIQKGTWTSDTLMQGLMATVWTPFFIPLKNSRNFF